IWLSSLSAWIPRRSRGSKRWRRGDIESIGERSTRPCSQGGLGGIQAYLLHPAALFLGPPHQTSQVDPLKWGIVPSCRGQGEPKGSFAFDAERHRLDGFE